MIAVRRIGALVVSAGMLALLAIPQVASAQATRTWVSGVGDDANPCSRTAPCKTFAGAISKTATGGEINCIDSGGFGGFTIPKSIQIDCRGVLAGILVSGTPGVTLNGAGIHVVLRGLDFVGLGYSINPAGTVGIRVIDAATVEVEDVTIRGFTNGIEFTSSENATMTLVHVTSQENLNHGMLVAPPGMGANANVSVFNSSFVGNVLTGVLVNDNSLVAITNTIVSGNGTHGIAARSTSGPAKISLDRVTSSSNGTSGVLATGGNAVINLSNVLLTGNAYGLYPGLGGSYVSFGNNRTVGNTTLDGTPTSVVPQF